MRISYDLLWAGFARALGAAVVLSPTLLLAVWAAYYLGDCLAWALAPDRTLSLTYQSATGPVRADFEGVRVDLRERTLAATRARLTSQDGRRLASAQDLHVTWLGNRSKVRVGELVARSGLREDGTLDLFDLAPPQADEPVDRGYSVHVESAYLLLVPHPGLGMEPQTLVSRSLTVDSFGGTTRVAADLLDQGRAHPLAVELYAGEMVSFRVRFDRFEATPWLPLIEDISQQYLPKDYHNWSARSVSVSGPALMVGSNGQPWAWSADLELEGSGVRVGRVVRNARVQGSMRTSDSWMDLDLSVQEPRQELAFDGWVDFRGPRKVEGSLSITAERREDLLAPLRELLPEEWAFEAGRFTGRVSVLGERWRVAGEGSVARAGSQDPRVENLRLTADLSDRGGLARLEAEQFAGAAWTAQASWDADRRLQGWVKSPMVELASLPLDADFLARMQGGGPVDAVLGGTLEAPEIRAISHGAYQLRLESDTYHQGVYSLAASYRDGFVNIDRGVMRSPRGVFTAQGRVGLEGGEIDLQLAASGVELSSYVPVGSGTAYAHAQVSGTWQDPIARGDVRVLALATGRVEVPVAQFTSRFEDGLLWVESLDARLGTGAISASGSLHLETGELAGTFSGEGFSLADWVNDRAFGTFSLLAGRVSGTLEEWEASARLEGSGWSLDGLDVDSAGASVTADASRASLHNLRVEGLGAVLEASGFYDWSLGEASLKAEFAGLDLAAVRRPDLPPMSGLVDGRLEYRLTPNAPARAEASLTLSELVVNETVVGDGMMALELDGDSVTAMGDVGSLERYVSLSEARWDTKNNTGSIHITAYNLKISDIVAMAELDQLPTEPRHVEMVRSLEGALSAELTWEQGEDGARWRVPSVLLGDLRLMGTDVGAIRAGGEVSAEGWEVESLQWRSEVGTLDFFARSDPQGVGELSVDAKNLDLAWASTWLPEAIPLHGKASVDLVVSGDLRRPRGIGSLAATIGYGQVQPDSIRVLMDTVELEPDRLRTSGLAYVQGFPLRLSAEVPFSAWTQPERHLREPVRGQIEVQRRQLDDLAKYLHALDPARTEGTVHGSVRLEGHLDNLGLQADLFVEAESLAMQGQEMALQNFELRLNSDRNLTRAVGRAEGSEGGSLSLDASATSPNLQEAIQGWRHLPERLALSGRLVLDELALRARLPGSGRASSSVVSGMIALGGNLQSPRVGGSLQFASTLVALPDQFLMAGAEQAFPIDPLFDLDLRAASGTRLQASQVDVAVQGTGRLSGRMSSPLLQLPLLVESGTVSLPTTKVELEEGGMININYTGIPGSEPIARVDLNLIGHTNLVAVGLGPTPENYRIDLVIRGNLLDDQALSLEATSDPPELTQEQIMAHLGMRRFFEALALGPGGGDGGLFRETLFAVALPALTADITEGLATPFGLDYVTLDYNAFDGAVLHAGRDLGYGVRFTMRRALQEPIAGELRYDLRLTWRVPSANRFLNRLRLGLGSDERRPWMFTIDWSHRF